MTYLSTPTNGYVTKPIRRSSPTLRQKVTTLTVLPPTLSPCGRIFLTKSKLVPRRPIYRFRLDVAIGGTTAVLSRAVNTVFIVVVRQLIPTTGTRRSLTSILR